MANEVNKTMDFVETQDLPTANNKEIIVINLDTIYNKKRNNSKEDSSIETGILFVSNLKEMLSWFKTDSKTNDRRD
ncbi:hypothetical protein SAMN05443669_10461 [Flavobacterium xanthum]|uniref:Uncharacterized protein n=2 Tax=Flavobacteriaceae TaxID=49546 RepID=A0A1M7JWB6_9FLAO|nr:hypothetical protein SAMN05443669_10461 [Flavobacterium xanthum]